MNGAWKNQFDSILRLNPIRKNIPSQYGSIRSENQTKRGLAQVRGALREEDAATKVLEKKAERKVAKKRPRRKKLLNGRWQRGKGRQEKGG